MLEGLLLLLLFAVFHPLFLLIMMLTVILEFYVKRTWITFSIVLPISGLLYALLFKQEGLLHFNLYDSALLGIIAGVVSIPLIKVVKMCTGKVLQR